MSKVSTTANRSSIAYWILGLCNNFGYVVMLSAAHDILARVGFADDCVNLCISTTVYADKVTNIYDEIILNAERHCNQLSTGIILLADILPSLTIKFISPFLPLWMNLRMIITTFVAALGFILVATSDSLFMALLGVACTSLSSGIGESSLLSYTVFYKNKGIISAWSSGTGGAGFFGAIIYAVLTALGVSPSVILFLLLSVPLSMGISFWMILRSPEKDNVAVQSYDIEVERQLGNSSEEQAIGPNESIPTEISHESFATRLRDIISAMKYVLPLVLVYYFEYVINQGLFELSLIDNAFIDRSSQYRWYQVCYQIGVFISRSSITFYQINRIWFVVAFQGLNMVIFTAEAVYEFIPYVAIVLLIILWEGLLGGAAYVNIFYKIQVNEPAEKREVVTGLTSISDSAGIALAGLTSIPLHNAICQLPRY